MNLNNLIIVTLLIISNTSCNDTTTNNNKGEAKGSDTSKVTSCSFSNDKFDSDFFPFEFENFSLSKMMAQIDRTTKIDSAVNGNKFYFFDNYPSKFSIVVYENNRAYLDGGSLKSNLFKSKNGIKIGMKRKAFLKIVGQSDNDCSTFTIKQNSMMYHFTFENDTLVSIDFDGL